MKATGLAPWEAVERFSDPDLLKEFQELSDSEGVLVEMARIGWPPNNMGKRVERYLELQRELLGKFEKDLARGEYVATGYDAKDLTTTNLLGKQKKRTQTVGRRKQIPYDLLSTLTIDYPNATASGGGNQFTALLIRLRSRGDSAAERACIKWLNEEKSRGYKPRTKLDLWKKVRAKFGERITPYAFENRIWPEVAEYDWKLKGRKRAT